MRSLLIAASLLTAAGFRHRKTARGLPLQHLFIFQK